MAMHAHHRREPQDGDNEGRFTAGSIFFTQPTEPLTGELATADITTFTTATGAFAIQTTINGVLSTTISTGEVVITNAADYASIVSAEAASRAAESSSRTTRDVAATSSASSGGSDNNMATLIPAIVVPIVVVLMASFGGFWWWMRRRHWRELKNTDFAMAGKGEKLTSRSNSSRAGTGHSASEKNFDVTVSEVNPPKPYASDHPKNSFEAIGLARAPGQDEPKRQDSRPQSPKMPFNGGHDGALDRGFQNFSGPRPNTARRPPPSHGDFQGRNRSNSSPANRGPPPGAQPWPRSGPGPRGPPPSRDIGPSPIMRNYAPQPLGSGMAQPHSPHAHPRPAPAPPTQNKLRAASPTTGINRSNVPAALDSPPTGAYNGASPISQYSPIVKETPNIGTVATFGTSPPRNLSSRDGNRPPPIITTEIGTGLGVGPIAVSKYKSRSPSPRSPEESFLTEENMRIARLANSSRLGFHQTSKPTSPGPNAQRPVADFSKPLGYRRNPSTGNASPLLPIHIAHSAPGQSPAATSISNPSPKLPPPATLSQLIPSDSPREERKPQWNYFGSGAKDDSSTSSVYTGLVAGHSRPLPGNSRSNLGHDTRDDDRKSEVSNLDAYEDIDAKSDVSSLNEFERFDFDSHHGSRPTSSSARGMGR